MCYPLLPGKRRRRSVSLFISVMPSDRGSGNANVALGGFGDRVGERSVLGRLKTRLSIARIGVSESETRLQLPPRPPKRQSKDCLFFCQSILAKTVKTPNFPCCNGELGAFCISWAILIYSQLFRPILPILVGGMSAPAAR